MKTINGNCPQFEWDGDDHASDLLPRHAEMINTELREWAESRRCVRCDLYDKEDHGFCNYFSSYTQETFSCAAFEEKK